MRLLRYDEHDELGIVSFDDRATPPYAVLSHTWGADAEEVTFADLGTSEGKAKRGYKKIRFCGQQARQDALQYFWVDTCCIDKTDKAELSHAIRSMFRWYQNATTCYVYLSDVSTRMREADDMLDIFAYESAFRASRWFTRGWTLQELLAPSTVEFFSQEGAKLGDKRSLKFLIHKITSISLEALDGAPLSQFSVNERLRWREGRVTNREEDGAYSLQGILDVELAPMYGEGATGAFRRLIDEIHKLERCVRDVRHTDPRDDKKRIEESNGGLLADSHRWILYNATFQQWQRDPHSRLLWVKGDPGKGKTMLLCGIIDELHSVLPKTSLLAYCFCQASDLRINSARAVLRGLLYMLVSQQPSLVSHVLKKHDHAGKALFEDANSWVALTQIFADVLRDPQLRDTYLIIDALDECVTDLPKLLRFIAKQSSASSRIKWIMSSRNWPEIEEQLEEAWHKGGLSLELNAELDAARKLALTIKQEVDQLAQEGQYEEETRHAVMQHFMSDASGTPLWVTLACQVLALTPKDSVLDKLASFPPGIDSLYKRMLRHIRESGRAETCRQVLALTAVLYRPVTISELVALVELPEDYPTTLGSVRKTISLCKSFLALQEDQVFFVHQSAKDFIFEEAFDEIFPDGTQPIHQMIFSRSLVTLSETLHRDMYNLEEPGYPIEDAKPPNLDPLASSRYSCVYWVDHLFDSRLKFQANSVSGRQVVILVDMFLREKYLYWLEGLSLCRSMAKGVVSMSKLCSLVQDMPGADKLTRLVHDAHRFVTYYKRAIESCPLQTYASALLFSPKESLVRKTFQHEEPKWITVEPTVNDSWGACLQTFEGHSDVVTYAAFVLDGKRLASVSWDSTMRIWDVETGELRATVKSRDGLMDFSRDGKRLASHADDGNLKLWNAESGTVVAVLESHGEKPTMSHGACDFPLAFSHDSKLLVSGSEDNNVRLWNAESGAAVRILESDGLTVLSVAFSPDGKRLAAGLDYGIIKLWDVASGIAIATPRNLSSGVFSVAFSPDSKRLVSSSWDHTVRLWNADSGLLVATLTSQDVSVFSLTFSGDSKRLASYADDGSVGLWDAKSGAVIAMLKDHGEKFTMSHGACDFPLAFSHDSKLLVSGSEDNNVRLWNAESGAAVRILESDGLTVLSVAFSPDGKRLAAGLDYGIIKLWDVASGIAIATLRNHSIGVLSIVFSSDSKRLVSSSWDHTVRLWDAEFRAEVTRLENHDSSVHCVAFSPDGEWLAVGSGDCTISLRGDKSGDVAATLVGHSECVTSLAFSPNGALLASCSGDCTVRLWDVESRTEVARFDDHSEYNSATAIAFSPDGKQLVLGSGDCHVRLVSAEHGEVGKLQATLGSSNSPVTTFAFSADGKRLVTGSEHGIFDLWDLKPSALPARISLRAPVFRENFSAVGSYENTNTGFIRLNSDMQLTHNQGDLFVAGEWVMLGSQRLLWLPPDYRATCTAVNGRNMVLGHTSGRVSYFHFECPHRNSQFDFPPELGSPTHNKEDTRQPEATLYDPMFSFSLPLLVDKVLRHIPITVLEPPVPPGKTRVHWTSSGKSMFDDYVELDSGAAVELEAALSKRYTLSEQTGGNGRPMFGILQRFRNVFGRQNGAQKQLRLDAEEGKHTLQAPSQGPAPMAHAGVFGREDETPKQEALRLLLCVDDGRAKTTLKQEVLQNINDDRELFTHLRKQYFTKRSWFTLRSVGTLSLAQFEVNYSNATNVYRHENICGITTDQHQCLCIPPIGIVGHDKEYLCNPAPRSGNRRLVPVLGPTMLKGDFFNPHFIAAGQRTTLNQLPKRRFQEELRANPDSMANGWGLHIEEDWHWPTIYCCFVATTLFSLVFGIVWSVKRMDIQGAFAVSGFALTLGAMFLGYMDIPSI